MQDYKGIKIYEKVIIVEKTSTTDGGYNWKGRTINQGYVVDINNKKMLENALSWAKWTKHDESILDGKYYWHKAVTDAMRKAYDASEKTIDGVIHEYKNGEFSITLDEAAGRSTQGGKLSFWNCIITAPDGRSFLIGINSELLLHLMMSTTLIKGTCQEKVWLGRAKGSQVGVFTPAMKDFAQAQKDESQRTIIKKANVRYIAGDVVKTLQLKELYLGTVYQYYEIHDTYRTMPAILVIYEKPKLLHVFRSISASVDSEDELISKNLSSYCDFRENKPKRVFVKHLDSFSPPLEAFNEYIDKEIQHNLEMEQEEDKKGYSYMRRYNCVWRDARDTLKFGTSPNPIDRQTLVESLEKLFKQYWRSDSKSFRETYRVMTEKEYKILEENI